MKKITLLFCVLCMSIGYAQQQIYNLGFEPGAAESAAANWTTFENPAPGLEIVANPIQNGTNTSATTQVLKLTMAQASACYAGAINFHDTLGTWELDPTESSNLTLSMDVNKSALGGGNIGVKFVNATNGTVFEITDSQGAVTTPGVWENLSWDISAGAASGENNNIDQVVVFIDFTCGNPDRASDVELLVDNISWGANKLTDPAGATCSDGILNGNETGVDCGGPDCPECITDPTVSAVQSPSTGTDLYVYSDIVGPTVANFNFNAFQGSGTISQVDIETDGNMTGKIENLSFYGAQWDAEDLVAGGYGYVHLDYYATTSTEFNFYLIDQTAGIPGGNPEEPRYRFGGSTPDEAIVPGEWRSVFIPLSHFTTYPSPSFSYDLNDIFQWKFDGNGTVYFDNIYFSTTNVLGTDDFTLTDFSVSPNPSNSVWTLKTNNQNITSIVVFDILGKEVQNLVPNTTEVNIDASGLRDGIYLAKISTANGTKTLKLVKN